MASRKRNAAISGIADDAPQPKKANNQSLGSTDSDDVDAPFEQDAAPITLKPTRTAPTATKLVIYKHNGQVIRDGPNRGVDRFDGDHAHLFAQRIRPLQKKYQTRIASLSQEKQAEILQTNAAKNKPMPLFVQPRQRFSLLQGTAITMDVIAKEEARSAKLIAKVLREDWERVIRVIDLYAGSGSSVIILSRAFAHLGVRVKLVAYAEIDPVIAGKLRVMHPEAINLGDVLKIDCKTLPMCDVLIAGPPCNKVSRASRPSKDVKDSKIRDAEAKADLLTHVRKIQAIREEIEPTFFLLENVATMPNHIAESVDEILEGCERFLINSSAFSATTRRRYYWSNLPLRILDGDSPLTISDCLITDTRLTERLIFGYERYNSRAANRRMELADEAEDETRNTDEARSLAIQRAKGNEKIRNAKYAEMAVINHPKQKLTTITTQMSSGWGAIIKHQGVLRKLHISEIERLQGIPLGFTAIFGTKSARIAIIGNGFNWPTLEFIFREWGRAAQMAAWIDNNTYAKAF